MKVEYLTEADIKPLVGSDIDRLDQTPEPQIVIDEALLDEAAPKGATNLKVGGISAVSLGLDHVLLTAQDWDDVQKILAERAERDGRSDVPAAPDTDTFRPASGGSAMRSPAPSGKGIEKPDVEFVDGALKFGSAALGWGKYGLTEFAPKAYSGAALPLQVGSVFLSTAAAASSFDKHGLSWKSAPALGAAALDLGSLVAMLYPPWQKYLPGAKFVTMGLKTLSAAQTAAPERLFLRGSY